MATPEVLGRDWMIKGYEPLQFKPAVDVLSEAFFDDPASVYILPDHSSREKYLPWLFGLILRYGFEQGQVYMTQEKYSGKVDGVSIWLPAERAVIPVISQIRLGMWSAPFRLGLRSFKRVLYYSNFLDRLRRTHLKQNFLWMLAVKPNCQGTGRGTALLDRGLKSLDGFHYLETHKENNLQFYYKQGFEVTFEAEISHPELHVWVMERP